MTDAYDLNARRSVKIRRRRGQHAGRDGDARMKFSRRPGRPCYGARVPGRKRALFLDWGGTLAVTRDNRTVVDANGHPCLAPNVAERLARERPRFDACFIVSNQARISRGEISEAEVLRRFRWADEQLGRPFHRLAPVPAWR